MKFPLEVKIKLRDYNDIRDFLDTYGFEELLQIPKRYILHLLEEAREQNDEVFVENVMVFFEKDEELLLKAVESIPSVLWLAFDNPPKYLIEKAVETDPIGIEDYFSHCSVPKYVKELLKKKGIIAEDWSACK